MVGDVVLLCWFFVWLLLKRGNSCPAPFGSPGCVLFVGWIGIVGGVLCGMGGKAPGTGTIAQTVSPVLKRCYLHKLPMLTILERNFSNWLKLRLLAGFSAAC